ncbi:MAG TPA: TlpA disulfide reductase family protein [Pyrinomonadaceae bacterium]|jgi:thiol-disulfide isomerase/thioredoxin|nr:TlpA disulfide reductase family protein [Pyrinomonadaceae bacterium]
MRKSLLLVLPLAAALAASAAGGQKDGAAKPPAPKASSAESAAPAVKEIKEAGLKELLGSGKAAGRPLLVNFWATWCVPCREEFPDLVKLRELYDAAKLDFALVSLDDPSDISGPVPAFLGEQRAGHFPSYLLNADDPDAAINLIDPTWHGELPATFVLDREGKIVYSRKGRIKVPELREALDAALK